MTLKINMTTIWCTNEYWQWRLHSSAGRTAKNRRWPWHWCVSIPAVDWRPNHCRRHRLLLRRRLLSHRRCHRSGNGDAAGPRQRRRQRETSDCRPGWWSSNVDCCRPPACCSWTTVEWRRIANEDKDELFRRRRSLLMSVYKKITTVSGQNQNADLCRLTLLQSRLVILAQAV